MACWNCYYRFVYRLCVWLGDVYKRQQLYPVKVDNANQTAVLDTDGNILPGVAEALGTENKVNIAKIA